jgi:hypothetical protein
VTSTVRTGVVTTADPDGADADALAEAAVLAGEPGAVED